ncbi:MAG: hypothetical protein Q8877_03385, partial [Sweet potato little leaf phytoplasma]|nr:hypothetical protein [Sweet potato little leaf phytoplasma]
EGEHVFLRVVPTTGVGRVMKPKKLSPKFIGPYQILKRVGPVAYQLALPPPFLSNIHEPTSIVQIEPDMIPLRENLTFETGPIRIED